MAINADRDLLFGLLALQNGMINQGQLLAAFQAWTLDKERGLADHLQARGEITAARRAAIEALAAIHVDAHGGDVGKSLAVVSFDRRALARLAELAEPAIEATLARVARNKGGPATEPDVGDADRTAAYSVGAATSDGQRFQILRPHARGGLGAVFVALDTELHREVALKQILERHADDAVSRQRFLIEAEITGALEHPGVVPVYGLGTDAAGRPYYAMRFIKGDSLKDAIAKYHELTGPRELELRRLLRRFLDVFNAVDYAHSRGVIHRDLKPANIIVGKHGETLVVDWGLAKAVGRADPSAGEQTLMPSSSGSSSETLPGSALGTPAYMSPEQARGELERLGPPSDVYSLGATLYCLLTGKPPFENDDVGAVPARARRAVRSAVPARFVGREGARGRLPEGHGDPERGPLSDGEGAGRRPGAVDGRRARDRLARAAVAASPAVGRRNRTVVMTIAASLLVALAGTGAVLAVQTRANGQLRRANNELAAANGRVAAANTELKAANERDKERFRLAMDAIKLFHGEVSQDLLLKERQFEGLRTKLLNGAADFYGRLENLLKGHADRDSRSALGKAYDELGTLTETIGDQTRALAVHRQALAVRRALFSEPGADAGTKLDVALSLLSAGALQQSTGDLAGARAACDEAKMLAEEAERDPAEARQAQQALGRARQLSGRLSFDRGDLAGALADWGGALTIRQKIADANPENAEILTEVSSSAHNSSTVLQRLGQFADAIAMMERARSAAEKAVRIDGSILRYQSILALHHLGLGSLLGVKGDRIGARAAYDRALVISQKLADSNPSVTSFQQDLARSYSTIGSLLEHTGDLAGGAGGPRTGAGHSTKTRRCKPQRHAVPARAGDERIFPRHAALPGRRPDRSTGSIRPGPGDPSEAGRRQSDRD